MSDDFETGNTSKPDCHSTCLSDFEISLFYTNLIFYSDTSRHLFFFVSFILFFFPPNKFEKVWCSLRSVSQRNDCPTFFQNVMCSVTEKEVSSIRYFHLMDKLHSGSAERRKGLWIDGIEITRFRIIFQLSSHEWGNFWKTDAKDETCHFQKEYLSVRAVTFQSVSKFLALKEFFFFYILCRHSKAVPTFAHKPLGTFYIGYAVIDVFFQVCRYYLIRP